jgi:hypothetical protein
MQDKGAPEELTLQDSVSEEPKLQEGKAVKTKPTEGLTDEFLRVEFHKVCNLDETNTYYPGEECIIETTPPDAIVQMKPMRVKSTMKLLVGQEIKNLMRKGYIRRSGSEWRSPIRPVMKPDGSVRMCMNLMRMNQYVKKDNESIPIMDDILDNMQGSKVFTVVDLKEGYFQIAIAKRDKHKTAFEINDKKYEWNRMPR